MKIKDRELAGSLETKLLTVHDNQRPLVGIDDTEMRAVFIRQLVDSVHRVKYVSVIRTRDISQERTNPHSDLFDPLRAAILYQRQENLDEAYWLVFLFVHFGKHPQAGWRYVREIYGQLGSQTYWNWENTVAAPTQFRRWLHEYQSELRRNGVARGFGNHRKYQSLDAYSLTGTGAAIESYVNWVKPSRTHQELIDHVCRKVNNDPRRAFDKLYHSMNKVATFGRLAKFDYLTMIGKLGLAPIEPGSTYMMGSTGPAQGARLLFNGDSTARTRINELDMWLIELEAELGVGMQVLEDALCNWQKSPREYQRFKG